MDMTREEEDINRALKQLLPHHIKTEMKHVDEHTRERELYVIYNKLMDYAQSRYPNLSPVNLYYLRRQVLAGICKTEHAWRQLVALLQLTDIKPSDMPAYSQRKPASESGVVHAFRGTVGVRMPYIGGGSVVFSVAAPSSTTSASY